MEQAHRANHDEVVVIDGPTSTQHALGRRRRQTRSSNLRWSII
jgi:hypothetical protein